MSAAEAKPSALQVEAISMGESVWSGQSFLVIAQIVNKGKTDETLKVSNCFREANWVLEPASLRFEKFPCNSTLEESLVLKPGESRAEKISVIVPETFVGKLRFRLGFKIPDTAEMIWSSYLKVETRKPRI